MRDRLLNIFQAYIHENNPDLSGQFQGNEEREYLYRKLESIEPLIFQLKSEGKPSYIIEELCMVRFTSELRPSKYNYLSAILEDEFESTFYLLLERKLLTKVLIDMIKSFQYLFDHFLFSDDTSENKWLRYALTGAVAEYLKIR